MQADVANAPEAAISLAPSAKPTSDFFLAQENPQFQDLAIGAKSAIAVFQSSLIPEEILLQKNSDQILAIASTSKLLTAVISLENYDSSRPIKITNIAANAAGGVLKEGDIFLAKDLLADMLIESNNGAAYALADAVGNNNFIKLMNGKALEIGMLNSNFTDAAGVGGSNTSTANDLVKLVGYIQVNYPQIFGMTIIPQFDLYKTNGEFSHKVISTDVLLVEPSSLQNRIIGGKTGDSAHALGCLILVLNSPNNRGSLINIILGSEDRFGEMKQLVNWENNSFLW